MLDLVSKWLNATAASLDYTCARLLAIALKLLIRDKLAYLEPCSPIMRCFRTSDCCRMFWLGCSPHRLHYRIHDSTDRHGMQEVALDKTR